MIPLFCHLSRLVKQLHKTLRYHHLPHLVRQFHSLHHLLYRVRLRLPHRLPWWLFRPWMMPMHAWIGLSRGWENWEYQMKGWYGMILIDYQWLVCQPSSRCQRSSDTWGLDAPAFIWDYIVLWWGPAIWMRLKWLYYSPCPWVGQLIIGLLLWMCHVVVYGMI